MRRQCPKCGGEEFEITGEAHDQCNYLVAIDDDGSIETIQELKTDVGETGWHGNARCADCECNINVDTGEEIDGEDNIFPYSVVLLYPLILQPAYSSASLCLEATFPEDLIARDPEIYFKHTMAKDPEEAVEKIQKMASDINDGTFLPEEFKAVAVFQGHFEMENGALQ